MTSHAVLTKEDHAELRIRTDRADGLGDAVMSCVVVPAEFRQVQDEYPILFRMNEARDGFTALAMFGFDTGENLFLGADGWDARYVPLAIGIQPFLIGRASPGAAEKQVHIDQASPRIGAGEGVRVFDADGRATPFLEAIAEKLGALDAGLEASAPFFAALRRHDLLEPLTLEITLDDGSTNRLVGYHVIDEAKVQALDGTALGTLHADDHLLPIFMVIASLGRIAELIARKNERNRDG